MKQYCTQNNGNCKSCSLSSYNRDCQNNLLRGGTRPGAGRPALGRKNRTMRLSDEEHEQVRILLAKLRSESGYNIPDDAMPVTIDICMNQVHLKYSEFTATKGRLTLQVTADTPEEAIDIFKTIFVEMVTIDEINAE